MTTPHRSHHPHLYWSRLGAWCSCACGTWKSRLYTTVSGAHLAFGEHLLDHLEGHR